MSGGLGGQVVPREAQAALEGLFGGDSRTNIHWLLGPALLSKTAIKVLLNMAMIGGDALLRGGDLHVGAEVTGEGTEIVIRAQGSRLLLDPELRAALEGRVAISDVTPRAAAAWLAHCLVQEAGGSIKVSEPQDRKSVEE